MNYRKDYDAYPDNHQDYDDYYDDYFYDEPDSGNSEEADFEDDWDEDFEPSPVRNQRHRSSSSKPAGRREEREDNLSVSYTHLDVYKRQVLHIPCVEI